MDDKRDLKIKRNMLLDNIALVRALTDSTLSNIEKGVIKGDFNYTYCGMTNYSAYREEIKHIRRVLMQISKIIGGND